jgi:diguanylate cyclase (GGDEF)-like protein
MTMPYVRRAIATAALVGAVVAPGTASAASAVDTPELVRGLATDAAHLVAQEQELLDLLRSSGDLSPTELAEARSTLRAVDTEGNELMQQLDLLGVDVTNAARAVLTRLPVPGSPGGQTMTPPPPPRIVYDAAIDDLMRIAATPNASTPVEDHGGSGSFALLVVAAAALLALGLAALSNTLGRSEDELDLAAMAWSDGLTGVANRRRLDRDIAARANPNAGPTAVIMVDVDHFKQVNDTYGHQVGDSVLREIGALLSAQVRHDDIVYRYGGEEFCILLPEASQSDARMIADRIVAAARSIELPDGNHVTVSVGVADGHPNDVAVTLETADRALYAAKAGGRNRTSTADTDSDALEAV